MSDRPPAEEEILVVMLNIRRHLLENEQPLPEDARRVLDESWWELCDDE